MLLYFFTEAISCIWWNRLALLSSGGWYSTQKSTLLLLPICCKRSLMVKHGWLRVSDNSSIVWQWLASTSALNTSVSRVIGLPYWYESERSKLPDVNLENHLWHVPTFCVLEYSLQTFLVAIFALLQLWSSKCIQCRICTSSGIWLVIPPSTAKNIKIKIIT